MRFIIVAALGKQRQIGLGNALPWKIKGDLMHFKALTMGHALLMGRRTFESLGKPLPGRENIVLSKTSPALPGASIAGSIEEALEVVASREKNEVMVIGGAMLYAAIIDRASEMHLSFINYEGPADAFFPEWDPAQWDCVKEVHYPAAEKTMEWTYKFLKRRPGWRLSAVKGFV